MRAKLTWATAALLSSAGAAMAQNTPSAPNAPGAPKAPSVEQGGGVNAFAIQQDRNGAMNYWTPERLREAKPMPLPMIDPKTLK
jgi:hypothetical protein